MRAGIIAGLKRAVAGNKDVSQEDSPARRAIIAGIVGGLAVAEAGGDEDAIKNGFLRSGGMVLVDTAANEASKRAGLDKPICLSAVEDDCVVEANFQKDTNGNVAFDANGIPKLDAGITQAGRDKLGAFDPKASQLWEQAQQLKGAANDLKTRAETAHARAHDHWKIGTNVPLLQAKGVNLPGVVLSYVGEGQGHDDHELEMLAAHRSRHGVSAGLWLDALRFVRDEPYNERGHRKVQLWLELTPEQKANVQSVQYSFYGFDFRNPKKGDVADRFRTKWIGYGCTTNAASMPS